MEKIDPLQNYKASCEAIGYVSRKKATKKDYERIGFMAGLEVHQQLKTKHKLFCQCPAGKFHKDKDYDAEIIRHMRPTLSELGEYDGTALMEFKTRKEITYHINNQTACTYEIDDTPPFKIDSEALEIALEISLLSKLNIVGEVHITRKQYLDGSIPAGFQRTAILGVEGEIQLSKKKIRLIQLSIEEDSCREISDIGHQRIYKTDRLGMPLIETVTYPECETPDELKEAAEYIRFLNRSTGKVRTGIGAGREDVNVSCKGGTRVEVKGVAHNKWIPELSHNECFRQYALLSIRSLLNKKVQKENWKMDYKRIHPTKLGLKSPIILDQIEKKIHFYAINLKSFKGLLSHFTQPGKCFLNEISDRIKVIACIEKPNLISSEDISFPLIDEDHVKIKKLFVAEEEDAQIIFWGPEEDIKTAIETIKERCLMAFDGVPNETRKSLPDGTTIFERVLPGADRMYPDTDSAPIPLQNEYINTLTKNLPVDIHKRLEQFSLWEIPSDTFTYILRNNLAPIIEKLVEKGVPPKYMGTFFGHVLKNIERKNIKHKEFTYDLVYKMFEYILHKKLELSISKLMIPILYKHPNMEMKSVLISLNFKTKNIEELLAPVDYLLEKFKETNLTPEENKAINWTMGQLHRQALGNVPLKKLQNKIREKTDKWKKPNN